MEHTEYLKERYYVKDRVRHSKQGLYKLFYKNGLLKEIGDYENNRKTGKWLVFYPNGAIKEEQYYFNGRPSAMWKLYNEKGDLILDIIQKSGSKDSLQ